VARTKKEEIAQLSAALLAAIDAPVPVNPTCHISKSKFMAGLQCAKREYLQVRHPELASSVDDSRIQQGIEVGSLARCAFPCEVDLRGWRSVHIASFLTTTDWPTFRCEEGGNFRRLCRFRFVR
jgi:hypothetical protein